MAKTYPKPDIAPPIFYNLDACPVREVLHHHTGKWSILTLAHLSFGSHRFSELLGALPDVSQRMLTQTLRRLERDGLVVRTAQATVPPRVDYSLSESGRTILPALQALLEWGATQRKSIETARDAYDAQSKPQTLADKTKAMAKAEGEVIDQVETRGAEREALRLARRRDVLLRRA